MVKEVEQEEVDVVKGDEVGDKMDDKFAEIWLGTHPNGPSVSALSKRPLIDLIKDDLDGNLGPEGKRTQDNVGFLLKILSIGKVLSIQSHPDNDTAKRLHESNPSVYKSPCHKPEMAVALTDFEAMVGFRPLGSLTELLHEYSEIEHIIGEEHVRALKGHMERTRGVGDFDISVKNAVKAVFESYMRNFPEKSGEVMSLLVERAEEAAKTRNCPIGSLISYLNSCFPDDCGVLAPLFLNVVKLKPGESIFVPSNTPHAYIKGEIIECMALSDNVIRCGLTPKFKDVEVLCETLSYESYLPRGEGGFKDGLTTVYRPPVDDFEVRVTDLKAGEEVTLGRGLSTPTILLVLSGRCELMVEGEDSEQMQEGRFGSAFFLSYGTSVNVKAAGEGCRIVRAMNNTGGSGSRQGAR